MKRYISAAANVNIGKLRENNEDNFYFNGKFLTEKTQNKSVEFDAVCVDERQLYAVCDGMGGEQLGELASLLTVETLHKRAGVLKTSEKNIDEELERCILEANNLIFEAQKESGAKRIGTTLALVAVENNLVHLYNIGDSRIYIFRGGKLEQLSADHTAVANLLKIGAITPEQAKTHPHRNRLTQYVGIDPAEMIIEAYKTTLKMKNKDVFLMCSDGLTDVVDEQEIADILTKTGTPIEAARELVNMALSREGRDNITVIIMKYNHTIW